MSVTGMTDRNREKGQWVHIPCYTPGFITRQSETVLTSTFAKEKTGSTRVII